MIGCSRVKWFLTQLLPEAKFTSRRASPVDGFSKQLQLQLGLSSIAILVCFLSNSM